MIFKKHTHQILEQMTFSTGEIYKWLEEYEHRRNG